IRRTPSLFYSVSCTTRAPRAGEIDGEDYQFLSDADFRERAEKGDFLEHAQVHGDRYGTLREPVVTNLKSGRNVLIDIDTQGAAVIRNCGDPLIRDALADVFLMPPDLEELRKRLVNRGTETVEQIDSRLATAAREMEHWRDYRYTIISGSIEEVFVVMTRDATEFISPLTLQTLSKNPVTTSFFDEKESWRPGHIELADRANLLLIAPATAHIIAELAHGLADHPLAAIALATRA